MSVPMHVETSRELPLVNIMVGFRVGSFLDPEGKEGLTKLMVRMLRRGAAGMDAPTLEAAIDRIGADFSEHVGISTVSLHIDVIRRSLAAGVELLAKMIGSAAFDTVELGKLTRETEGEIIEARDSDRSLCARAFRRSVFEGHPFSRRTSGLIPTVRSITREEILGAYERTFARDNCAMAFSGDISESEAASAAEVIAAALPKGKGPQRTITDPVFPKGRRLVFVDKPERTQTQLLIGGVGTHVRDEDHIPLHVANTVFGGTFTSRLMREVRSKRGWSYGAYASLPIDVCREAFSMWTHPSSEDAAACLELELSLLQKLRDSGIKSKELSFAKKYLVRSHAFEVDTASKRVHRKLATSLYDLPPDYYDSYLDRVRAVTKEQANEAVRRRLSSDDLVVAITGTHASIGEKVAAAIPGLVSQTVVPFDLE